MNEIDHKEVDIEIPFRLGNQIFIKNSTKIIFLAIIGQMASGKSYLARKIIENIDTITYSERNITTTEVIFISKSGLSASEMSSVCKKKSINFTWWKLIHPLNNIFKDENTSSHIIIVMEDVSGDINSSDSKFNSDIVSFLFRSRHHNVSVINILHGIGHAMTRRNSFERVFLDNISGLFVFKPINNKKIIFNYLKKFLNKSSVLHLEEIFNISEKYMSHPYIFIQPHKHLIDEISKIRIDIFKHNIILQSGI